MPRVTRSSQKQIEFRCRKTRSQNKEIEGSIESQSKQAEVCSISPRKRRDPIKACRTPVTVSPKKKKNNRGKPEDVICSDAENSDPKQRLSFACQDDPKSPNATTDKQGRCKDVTASDTKNPQPKQILSLARQDGHQYSTVRKALHSSHPDNLLCREKEITEIRTFLQNHLLKGKPGSLYISGAPGTGKTACLTKIMLEMKAEIRKCQVIFVNCMALKHPQDIFKKIAVELVGEDKCPTKATQKFLEEEFSSSKQTRIIILDEMDQLESKHQEILYTMFEWPSLPKSKLILIGIANALDLTDRILPRLQARPKCKPELLHFAPYSREQIVKIIQDRLSSVEAGSSILDAAAVQFCARKVSAMAGDMRKALDICRRAVEVLESGERKQQILQPVKKAESPSKRSETPPKPKKVGISQIASVVAEVYGSRLVAGPGVEQPTIPLQQKLLICTFCKICARRKVSQLGQEDFLGLCNILETRGLLGIKRAQITEEEFTEVMNMLEAEPTSAPGNSFPAVSTQPDIPALREQLAVLVSTGKAKEAIGVQLTHENVKRLSDKDVEKYTKRYETYVGSKTTDSLIDSFIFLVTKAVGMAVDVKDIDAYQKELKNDYIINKELSNLAGSMSLKCGRFLAVANAALITTKHINLEDLKRKYEANSEEISEQSSPTAE